MSVIPLDYSIVYHKKPNINSIHPKLECKILQTLTGKIYIKRLDGFTMVPWERGGVRSLGILVAVLVIIIALFTQFNPAIFPTKI